MNTNSTRPNFLAKPLRTIALLFYLLLILLILYMLVCCTYQFNYEEFEIGEFIRSLTFALLLITIIPNFFRERSELDMERKVIWQKSLLGGWTETPFDRITSFNFSVL